MSKNCNCFKTCNSKKRFRGGRKINGWLESKEVLPDVIFIVINMPVMGGFEFLAELKEMKYKTQELDEVFPVYIELLRKGSVRKGLE